MIARRATVACRATVAVLRPRTSEPLRNLSNKKLPTLLQAVFISHLISSFSHFLIFSFPHFLISSFPNYLYPFTIGTGVVAVAVHCLSISTWQIIVSRIRSIQLELDILRLFGF